MKLESSVICTAIIAIGLSMLTVVMCFPSQDAREVEASFDFFEVRALSAFASAAR